MDMDNSLVKAKEEGGGVVEVGKKGTPAIMWTLKLFNKKKVSEKNQLKSSFPYPFKS